MKHVILVFYPQYFQEFIKQQRHIEDNNDDKEDNSSDNMNTSTSTTASESQDAHENQITKDVFLTKNPRENRYTFNYKNFNLSVHQHRYCILFFIILLLP